MTALFEEGHDFIYRVTAYNDRTEKLESKYYVDPRRARFWRDQLRATGFEASVARTSADAFESIDDATLNELDEKGREGK